MADYSKSVNFAVKDTLTSGDPNKIVSGAEIDTEFNNIASASTSKANRASSATENNIASLTSLGHLKDSGRPDSALIPAGGIIMWSGAIDGIPSGWALCDGTNGTPDLRNRFVVGAGDSYAVNATGGADSVTLTEDQMPSHNHAMNSAGNHSHTGTTNTTGNHTHSFSQRGDDGGGSPIRGYAPVGYNLNIGGGSGRMNSAGNHSHTLYINSAGAHAHTIYSTGGGQSHENRPPYYALAYIMKL